MVLAILATLAILAVPAKRKSPTAMESGQALSLLPASPLDNGSTIARRLFQRNSRPLIFLRSICGGRPLAASR